MSRMKLLGVEVDALGIDDLHAVINQAVAERRQWIIANHNIHSVYLYHRDPKMKTFYARARCTHIDGMPIVWLGRLLGLPLRREHRVTYVDWVRPLVREATRRGYRVFYLGSAPGVADRGAATLRRESPGLQIATHHGYFGGTAAAGANAHVLSSIRDFRPDILMVGMGMPLQEHWILDNIGEIDARVILSAGACMDYVAGVVPTAPRWMGRWGIEWLHRLWSDPIRLWRRYLLEPWFVFRLFIRDLRSRP